MRKVVFSSNSAFHLPDGKPAQQTELAFDCESSIFMSDMPKEYGFAYFKTEDGRYIYTSRWGWQFTGELPKTNAFFFEI
jgi:hypothetical protein